MNADETEEKWTGHTAGGLFRSRLFLHVSPRLSHVRLSFRSGRKKELDDWMISCEKKVGKGGGLGPKEGTPPALMR